MKGRKISHCWNLSSSIRNSKQIGALVGKNSYYHQSLSVKSLPETEAILNNKPNHDFRDKYDPALVEKDWYPWWEHSGFFQPIKRQQTNKTAFTTILPPPNVTGDLHIGHALTCTIEDILVRWRRMKGDSVNWIPGTDHAGIATQSVVEKNLVAKGDKGRIELGREKFSQIAMEWKNEYQSNITNQLRTMGISANWKEEYFTLNSEHSELVKKTFIKLFDDDLIYRSTKMVQWCPHLRTVISDIEVDKVEIKKKKIISVPFGESLQKVEVGVIYDISYKVHQENNENLEVEELIVSTTRPETLVGDVAVAIHPEDDRYRALHGRRLVHPITQELIPVVLDAELVQMDLGSGAVKVTPAHDFNDYECGKRHNLTFKTIFDFEGNLLEEHRQHYEKIDRFNVRKETIALLKERNAFIDAKEFPTVLPLCSRSGDLLEPMIMPQWFLNTKPLIKKVQSQISQGNLKFVPSSVINDWNSWLDNPQEWCISRQIWWGHTIPVYKVGLKENEQVDNENETFWVAALNEQDALEKAAIQKCCSPKDIVIEEKVTDVLDTWFSSALIPSLVTKDNTNCYPLDLLETGGDILFFWVARMAMLSTYLTGSLPFRNVVLHPLICDSKGRKMSKSLGNVIDPLDIIHGASVKKLISDIEDNTNINSTEKNLTIKERKKQFRNGIFAYGTDSLRFTLCHLYSISSQKNFIKMDLAAVDLSYQFATKIWNTFRFSRPFLEKVGPKDELKDEELRFIEKWILHRLSVCIEDVDVALSSYQLNLATAALYQFLWNDFCPYYIENIKSVKDEKSKHTASIVLHQCLHVFFRLLHPFMPFLTEELISAMPHRNQLGEKSVSISTANFPEVEKAHVNEDVSQIMDSAKEIITVVRSVIKSCNLPKGSLTVYVSHANKEMINRINEAGPFLNSISEIAKFESTENIAAYGKKITKGSLLKIKNDFDMLMFCEKDHVDWKMYLSSLETKMVKPQKELAIIEKKLQKGGIPPDVKSSFLEKQQRLTSELSHLQNSIDAIIISKA